MVSDRPQDGFPHPVAPFLRQESSAQYYDPTTDQRLPRSKHGAGDIDGQRKHGIAAQADERFLEARHNGTDGNAVILPFHPGAHGESRNTQSRNGHEISIPVAAKPRPVVSEKPRVKTKAVKAKTPETGNGAKPPRVGVNIEWVQKGVGWDCREVYYVGKQRRRRHLGHIGKQKWEEMQEQHQGKALEEVLRDWIEARRAEKSMSLKSE
jgi:hypothetical protein